MRDSPDSDLRHGGSASFSGATTVAAASAPIEVDPDEVGGPAGQRLDGKKPSDYTDREWADLEGHMAAYFKSDVDILANSTRELGAQRWVSILRFARYYMRRLDEKFPSPDDDAVRNKMNKFFAAVLRATDFLLIARIFLLTGSYAVIALLAASLFPKGAAPAEARPAVENAAAAGAMELTPEMIFLYGVGLLLVVYVVIWIITTMGTKSRLQALCSSFQSDFQQSDVKKLFNAYLQTPNSIVVARRRRQKSADETNVAVMKIERYTRYMVWLAKRVEYYEKAFEVRFWRMLDHDFWANLSYSTAAVVFVGIFWVMFGRMVDAERELPVFGAKVPLEEFGVGVAVGIYVLSFFVLSRIPSLRVASTEQLEEWLKIKNWTRYSKFDLHNGVADLVGDQVKEVHHAEDQIRG